jgi:hypothetical protein
MGKPGYCEPDGNTQNNKWKRHQEALVYLIESSVDFRIKGYEEKEEPRQYEKDDGEHYQYQYRISIIPPYLALQTKILHIIRTGFSAVVLLQLSEFQVQTTSRV